MEKKIFVHLLLSSFDQYKDKIAEHKYNIELLITANDLDSRPYKKIKELAGFLGDNQLSCTIHGPFLDLNPGSMDSKIRQVSQERYKEVLSVVAPLKPVVVVLHAAFNPVFYHDDVLTWIKTAVDTFRPVVEIAREMGIRIAIENVLEKTPEIIKTLLQYVDSPFFGACFDIGHSHIFSHGMWQDWIRAMGERIFEFHLHDNHGKSDEHLAIGEGDIDFPDFFSKLLKTTISPLAYTIEAHNEEQAVLSLERLSNYLGF